MSEERCEDCHYWRFLGFSNIGGCHRYAPSPVGPRYLSVNQDLPWEYKAEWPRVTPGNWCGEFKKERG